MSTTVQCARCARQQAPALERAVYPGALGEAIRRRVCRDCWDEWQQAEVMVINELRLNMMDPEALEILTHHMREFLGLEAT